MSTRKKLNNFSDPIGLLRRMLSSGNRAAYAALIREGLGIAVKPVDAVLSIFERQRFRRPVESDQPLVFIVGAPRSGTTLIYQALAHYLDVTYPSNLTAMFPKSPLTTARLQRLIPTRQRPDFKNFYGQTTRLQGPNDAFHLWNRWLGDDRYLPGQVMTSKTASNMRQFFDTWSATYQRPFLNKNNRNAFAIERLARELPNARFVVVRRNPLFVAQSLIIARQKVQGDKATGWGLQSYSTEDPSDPLAYVEDVCRQIVSIDEEMNRQIETVSECRVVEITYEGFCESPADATRRIVNAFKGVKLNPRRNGEIPRPFEVSKKLSISEAEQARIRACFSEQPARCVNS